MAAVAGRWISLLIASVGTVALLAYSGVLILRLWSGGVGRLGSDVIAIAYVSAASALLGSLPAAFASRSRTLRTIGAVVLLFAVLATTFWLVLHLGGFVYSHESAMSDYDSG
jgi:hypothetical protein